MRRWRGALAGIALAGVAICLIGWLCGWRTHVMTTPSMGRTAPVGTVVVSRPESITRVRVGQIIVFHPPGQPGVTFAHRVRQIHRVAPGPAGVRLTTRGDINGSTDPWVVGGGNLIGHVVLRIPAIGFLLEMLPAALAVLCGALLLTLTLAPARRYAARVLLLSLGAGALIVRYRPLVHVALIAQTIVDGRGVAGVVPTGLLPVRVQALHGSHADLVPGQVGVVHLARVRVHGAFALGAHLHLFGWWWLVVLACLIPVLAGLRRAPVAEAAAV